VLGQCLFSESVIFLVTVIHGRYAFSKVSAFLIVFIDSIFCFQRGLLKIKGRWKGERNFTKSAREHDYILLNRLQNTKRTKNTFSKVSALSDSNAPPKHISKVGIRTKHILERTHSEKNTFSKVCALSDANASPKSASVQNTFSTVGALSVHIFKRWHIVKLTLEHDYTYKRDL